MFSLMFRTDCNNYYVYLGPSAFADNTPDTPTFSDYADEKKSGKHVTKKMSCPACRKRFHGNECF